MDPLLANADDHQRFLEETARERRNREITKAYTDVATRLQALARGYLARKRLRARIRNDLLSYSSKPTGARSNTELLRLGSVFLAVKAPDKEFAEVVTLLCQCLTTSMRSASKSESFAALLLSKDYLPKASHLIAELIRRVPAVLGGCDLDRVTGVRSATALVDFLHLHSAACDWTLVRTNKTILQIFQALCSKNIGPLSEAEAHANMAKCLQSGLKRSKPAFSSETTNAFFAVFMRTLQNAQFNDASVDQFIKQILAVPALILHLSQANLQELKSSRTFEKVVARLTHYQRNVADLSHIDSLHLLANFVHLSYLEQEALVEHLLDWTATINVLLGRCQSFDGGKRKNNWHHPILGWTNERIDDGTQGVAGRVMLQLSYLWSTRMVTCLFGKVLGSCEQRPHRSSSSRKRKPSSETERLPVEMVQKLLKKLSVREQTVSTTTIPPVSLTAVVCQLYQLALLTFPNSHIDILSGLCRDDTILLQLWNFVNEDNTAGLNNYLSFLSVDPTVTLPHFAPLHLFADIACSLISILDEKEMYENGTPFKLAQLCEMAKFANTFCFRVIWEKSTVLSEHRLNALFQSIYQLCTILYNRDCRRPFTNKPNFWIVNDVKASVIVAEFEKHTTRAQMLMQKMPHVVPLRERMLLFRKLVQQDKDSIDLPGTVITVERTRIVEDGYRQLANLSSQALRATIRVKFINQQGLDEAGIDQDGVFKEFLEVTIKKVFDPELNLFKSTSNHLLYPSHTSYVHDQHLQLFQFVGRMLAKAVYEGICVDVQLAPVLLATVLGKQLCPFDELSTLDPELYKNLTYVKHYADSDDVADLELTFSYNEEFLGKVSTVDLIPGGSAVKVTNENKIMYIHKMAQFRVLKQTKQQCEHFVTGFRSIVNPKWLTLFSIQELQYLISGQTTDIDMEDLRKHVQYYGGFHSNHRLIKWLWQILEHEFTAEERHLFLKFVTSCSRPPLLGFAYLEPAFSIRCVETSDDMDQGDTLGSVIRGFLAIKRKQPMTRLPTASTCFNLLKLPNYMKKSVLLEKLRYAIHAETGFELS